MSSTEAVAATSGADPVARLYFVRHGRSTHNESNDDRPLIWDAPLHKIGIRQAALLRQRLKDVPLAVAVASPLTRALQTALIALGDWSRLAPGAGGICGDRRVTLKRVRTTLQVDKSGTRFDASDDDAEPLDGSCLGPGAKVRLLKDIRLCGSGCQPSGSTCTVTNAEVTLADSEEPRSCLQVFPMGAPRCRVVAWPEATEQMHESDDLGSPAPELRRRFPTVDFSRLPPDGRTWWWSDPALPSSADALAARGCWEQHGTDGPQSGEDEYDEPEANLRRRISRLAEDLTSLAAAHQHVALFAHYWVLREVWRQRFGQRRRFDNAELAVVDVLPGGEWRWVRDENESDSDGAACC